MLRVHASFLPCSTPFQDFTLSGIERIETILFDGNDHATIAGNVAIDSSWKVEPIILKQAQLYLTIEIMIHLVADLSLVFLASRKKEVSKQIASCVKLIAILKLGCANQLLF